MGGEIGKRIKLTPVFITPDDRDNFRSIRNTTKEQIKDLTLRELSQIRAIGLEEQALALETTYRKKIKTATKDVMINFYKSEVLPVLDEAENYIVGKISPSVLLLLS